jgi:hypothetical protein
MRTQASEQAVQPMSEDQGIPEAGLTSASTQELAKELGVWRPSFLICLNKEFTT